MISSIPDHRRPKITSVHITFWNCAKSHNFTRVCRWICNIRQTMPPFTLLNIQQNPNWTSPRLLYEIPVCHYAMPRAISAQPWTVVTHADTVNLLFWAHRHLKFFHLSEHLHLTCWCLKHLHTLITSLSLSVKQNVICEIHRFLVAVGHSAGPQDDVTANPVLPFPFQMLLKACWRLICLW